MYKNRLILIVYLLITTSGATLGNPLDFGQLDLRDFNFEEEGLANLNTNWEFFYREFVPPDSIEYREGIGMPVPSDWANSSEVERKGIGTYSLKILLPEYNSKKLAFKVPELSSAYKMFVNGQLVAQAGVVGFSLEESVPETKPQIVLLNDATKELTVVIHVSNFHHKKSGLWDTILIGPKEVVNRKEKRNYFFAIFLSGGILIIGLYHIGLFFLQTKDRSAIYFSLFAIATVVRIVTTGEMLILDIFPSLSWEWRLTLDHLSMYIASGVGVMHGHSLFPGEMKKKPALFFMAVALVFSAAAILTKGTVNSHFVFYYQLVLLVIIGYIFYVMVMIVKNEREGGIAYALGYLVIGMATMNDVLHSLNFITTFYMVPFGVFLFFFSQAFVLSIRSAQAFLGVEKLSLELRKANQELEQKILDRTEMIVAKNAELHQINIDLEAREAELQQKAAALQSLNKDLHEAKNESKQALSKEIATNKELENTLNQLRETQDYLIQSEKMASLGQLTAGIAHEINNPINFISVGVDCLEPLVIDLLTLLAEYGKLDTASEAEIKDILLRVKQIRFDLGLDDEIADEAEQLLQDVKEGVKRTIEIVNGLSDFSRGENGLNAAPADINRCIESCLLMLKNKYKNRIDVLVDYDPAVSLVVCKVGQIHQVLVNIMANAIQAIDGDGQMRIQTKGVDDTLRISIKDTGKGMSETVLQKIFDPFFTTKEVGEGTGLGLSITHGIIANHGGKIHVKSKEGVGSEFIVELPIQGVYHEERTE